MRNRFESLIAGAIGAGVMALLVSPLISKAEASYNPIPSGVILHVDAANCPTGWTAYAAAEGRYIVSKIPSATSGLTAGTAFTASQENRATGVHSHTNSQAATTQAAHAHNLNTRLTGGSNTGTNRIDGLLAGLITQFWDSGTIDGTSLATPTITNGAITIDPSAGTAGTNAPYIQLLACKKT
jgi:hypothetical protein